MELSDNDWNLLGQAPLAVFALVAMSDGGASENEIQAFTEDWIRDVEKISFMGDPRNQEILKWVLQDESQHFTKGSGFNLERGRDILKRLPAVFSKMEEENADAYRSSLLKLARQVSEGSRQFLGLGAKVSKAERRAIAEIQELIQKAP